MSQKKFAEDRQALMMRIMASYLLLMLEEPLSEPARIKGKVKLIKIQTPLLQQTPQMPLLQQLQ